MTVNTEICLGHDCSMARIRKEYYVSLALIIFFYMFRTKRDRQMQRIDVKDVELKTERVTPPSSNLRKSFTLNPQYKVPATGGLKLCRNESASLSLWLMPPTATRKKLQNQIDHLASTRNGALFPPHVTVVGAFPCKSEDEMRLMVKNLQEGLAGFGRVPCSFKKRPSTFEVWNQALIYELKVSPRFITLCQESRDILGLEGSCEFPQPVGKPHLSLYYGNSIPSVPDEIEPIQSFDASYLTLWVTDPPTLNGVPEWKQIAIIDL